MIVRFASVSDVREFVGLATLQPYAIDVVDGEHVVSAKNFICLLYTSAGKALILNSSGGAAEACLRISRRLRGEPMPLMRF